MQTYKIKIVLVFIGCFVLSLVNAQQKDNKTTGKSFLPSETIYLQLSQSYYFPGEVVWFKVYCLEEPALKPSKISSIALVELINSNNLSLIRKKILLENGTGYGEFILPDTISTSVCYLLAYTNWMKNFSNNDYYKGKIKIINQYHPFPGIQKKEEYFEAKIYPECNKLFIGTKNKIILQTTSRDKRDFPVNCFLISNKTDTIQSFKIVSEGIKDFYLTPEKGNIYQLILQSRDKNRKIRLPEPVKDGGYLSLSEVSKSKYSLKVFLPDETSTRLNKDYYLSVQRKSYLRTLRKLNRPTGELFIELGKNDLFRGLNHLILHDAGGKIYCSRPLYFNDYQKLNVQLNLNNSVFGFREEAELTIQCLDTSGNAIPASLSVTVRKKEPMHLRYENSVLKHIQAIPEWYGYNVFDQSGDEDTKLPEIYNWLLTNTKQPEKSENIYQPSKISINYRPEHKGIRFSGKIINNHTGEACVDSLVLLSLPGKVPYLGYTFTDLTGRFDFQLKPGTGTRDLVITLPSEECVLKLDDPYINGFSENFSKEKITINEEESVFLESRYLNYQINQKFNLRNYKLPQTRSVVDAGFKPFYGIPDQVLRFNDYIPLDSLREYFYELIPNVFFRMKKKQYMINFLNPLTKKFYIGKPGVFVDGVIYNDYEHISQIPPSLIERIDVFKTRYYYHDLIFYGIINIVTRKGDFSAVPLSSKATRIIFPLSSESMQFIHPDHSVNSVNERSPDFRDLLLWEPNVQINKHKIHVLRFYTGDNDGEFEIIIEGITDDGTLIYKRKTFSVKNM